MEYFIAVFSLLFLVDPTSNADQDLETNYIKKTWKTKAGIRNFKFNVFLQISR